MKAHCVLLRILKVYRNNNIRIHSVYVQAEWQVGDLEMDFVKLFEGRGRRRRETKKERAETYESHRDVCGFRFRRVESLSSKGVTRYHLIL